MTMPFLSWHKRVIGLIVSVTADMISKGLQMSIVRASEFFSQWKIIYFIVFLLICSLTWSTSPRCIDQKSARQYMIPTTASTTTPTTAGTTVNGSPGNGQQQQQQQQGSGCGPAPIVPFGYMATPFFSQGAYFGATASYVCQPGFRLIGPSPVSYCLQNGFWSPPPTCCNPIIPMMSCMMNAITSTAQSQTTTVATSTNEASTNEGATSGTSTDETTTNEASTSTDSTDSSSTDASAGSTSAASTDSASTTTEGFDYVEPGSQESTSSNGLPCDIATTTPNAPCSLQGGFENKRMQEKIDNNRNLAPTGNIYEPETLISCDNPARQPNEPCREDRRKWRTVFPLAWFTVAPPTNEMMMQQSMSSDSENLNPAFLCCGSPPVVAYANPVDLEPVLHDDFVVKTIASHVHGLTRSADVNTQRKLKTILSSSNVVGRSRRRKFYIFLFRNFFLPEHFNFQAAQQQKSYCAGDSISYICNDGMELAGPAIVSCMMNGRWSLLPSCQPLNLYERSRPGVSDREFKYNKQDLAPVQNDDRSTPRDSCGALPPSVKDAYLIDQSFNERFSKIGDTATYACEPGFRMVGYKTVFCLSHDTWSPLPVCEADLPLCSQPPHVPHSKVEITRGPGNADEEKKAAKVGDRATYKCDPGFKLDGHPVSYCLANGEWTPPPDCDELACPEPSFEKGEATYESLTIGSTAFFSCDEDYKLVGPPTANCLINASWTPFPECIGPIRCRWGGKVPGIGKTQVKVPTADRQNRLSSKTMSIFTSLPLQCPGMIKQWNLWNSAAGSVVIYADVWRMMNVSTRSQNDYVFGFDPSVLEGEETFEEQFVLLGTNRLVLDSPGTNSIPVEASHQIFVKNGDFIGIRYEKSSQISQNNGAILLVPTSNQQVTIVESYPASLIVNTGYRFSSSPNSKSGIPLLSAVIENVQEIPYGPCNPEGTTCPLNSHCAARSCAGHGCICSEGFWPNANRTRCLEAAHLGDQCTNKEVSCMGYNVHCSPETGRCACWDNWVPAADGKRCVRRLESAKEPQALLNETCSLSSPKTCYFGRFDQECTSVSWSNQLKCQCRSGYRPATPTERRAFPDDGFECRPEDYDLSKFFLFPIFIRQSFIIFLFICRKYGGLFQ